MSGDFALSTVVKALAVLDLFSENRPQIGASEAARLLGWDKSTVQRYLSGLTEKGILEQDPRDKTHPVAGQTQAVLAALVEQTGETAHASRYLDGQLRTSAIVESNIRGTRVYIDPGEPLPLHASGSGIAFLSRSTDALVKQLLTAKLTRYTEATETRKRQLYQSIALAADTGYAKSIGTFESDVIGVAAAVVDFDGFAVGAVSVATPAARFKRSVEKQMATYVMNAAAELSSLYGYAQSTA
jgi:DNA-binding IclR family transcriptional regulator